MDDDAHSPAASPVPADLDAEEDSASATQLRAPAGIILCGGGSRRMGRPKAWLPWQGVTLLQHVVAVLRATCSPLFIVAAAEQELPALTDVHVLRDPLRDQGPLVGLAAGLHAASAHRRRAFVTSTDAPFMSAAFVRSLQRIDLAATACAVIPRVDGHRHPLCALFDTATHGTATALVQSGTRRLLSFVDEIAPHYATSAELLAEPELSRRDPELRALINVNTLADYEEALRLNARAETRTPPPDRS